MLAIKKNKVMSLAGKYVSMEFIRFSEINQMQNDWDHMFSLPYCRTQRGKKTTKKLTTTEEEEGSLEKERRDKRG